MKIITRKEAKAQGLTRYFTGKPCKWGHVAQRLVSIKQCLECGRNASRKHYAENRERNLDRDRQWRAKNPERVRELRRHYYANNRDREIDRCRRWKIDNRERYFERQRQYLQENREQRSEYNRQWRTENPGYLNRHRSENPEKYVAYYANRRAAKMDRTLFHDEELTQFVMEEAAQQARDMEETFGMPFHVDHMIPMQGNEVSGLHVWYNLQVLPASLNVSKGNRMIYTESLEWLAHAS